MAEIKTITTGEVTMRKIIGAVTVDDLLNAVLDSYAGHITKNVVWDLSIGSVEQLTSDDLRSINIINELNLRQGRALGNETFPVRHQHT